MSSPHYVLVNMNYPEIIHELYVRIWSRIVIDIIRPPTGTWDGGEDVYVGFTPYANILRSYRALCLNAMRQWWTKRTSCIFQNSM